MAQPHVIYQAKPGSALEVNRDFYARLGPDAGKRTLVERFRGPNGGYVTGVGPEDDAGVHANR